MPEFLNDSSEAEKLLPFSVLAWIISIKRYELKVDKWVSSISCEYMSARKWDVTEFFSDVNIPSQCEYSVTLLIGIYF